MTNEELVTAIAKGREPLLGIREILKLLMISRSTLDRWIQEGKFVKRFFTIGGKHKYAQSDFKVWLMSQTTKP